MAREGGLTSKFYRETAGIKVTGGQFVRRGTLLTRQGDRWKPGRNVIGRTHLNAACDGTVVFSRRRGNRNKSETLVHIEPVPAVRKSKGQPAGKAA